LLIWLFGLKPDTTTLTGKCWKQRR